MNGAAAGRAGAGHLLDQQPAARPQPGAQGRAEPRVLRGADVLAHLHRGDRVVAVVQRVPVVLDPDLGAVPEAQAAGPLPDVAALLAGQRHAGHPDSVVLGGVDGQRTPAAAHIEQPLARLEAELAADQLELGALRIGQRGGARGPAGAGIGHAGVQDELVERGGQVVAAGDHGLVAGPAVQAAADAELAAGRCGRRAEELELSRRLGRGPRGGGQRNPLGCQRRGGHPAWRCSYPRQGELADADVPGPEAGFGIAQVELPHPVEHLVES